MIFVTLTRIEAFGNKCRAGFVNYGKKWPQYHGFSRRVFGSKSCSTKVISPIKDDQHPVVMNQHFLKGNF